MSSGRYGLSADLDLKRDVSINFIGLFDTVAGIGDVLSGDFSVGDERSPGVNLYLPPGCARKVISLRARDEYRANFALNSVVPGYEEIMLPGVHSDVGGGYPSRAREHLILSKPIYIVVGPDRRAEDSAEWKQLEAEAEAIRATGIEGGGSIKPTKILVMSTYRHHDKFMLVVLLDRPVRGELSRISLRVMRNLAVKFGVPFELMDEQERPFVLPEELLPINQKILDQVEGGTPVMLGPDEELLLRSRYIHESAHWGTKWDIAISKPEKDNQRVIHPHRPQPGYPQ
jgi:type VI secretion system secreted protein VgrG